ncbi:ATP-binding protein [Aquimarina sp. MMG016]|uniref:ATP-binding protein n=1 Tax=Aquimarina sp. MMG016 TaxID=2822690 RepID=UPI001B3A67B4|nr:ATP-binding protein [Aquimarina sp. MMG016]MBQ4820621.1 tetratricopeptide repeat protein [Aquimarina sp. MMG016]
MPTIKNITFFLIFISFLVQSQNEKDHCKEWRKKIDTISNLERGIQYGKSSIPKLSSTCRIKAYVEIGMRYAYKYQIDSSFFYIDKGIKLAKDLEAKEELSYAYSRKAEILIGTAKYDDGKNMLIKAKSLLKDFPNSTSWTNYYDKQGYYSYIKGDYQKAIKFMDSTVLASKKSKDTSDIHNYYENLGVVYKRLSAFEKAIEYFIKSVKIKEQLNALRSIGETYRYLGSCYNELGQYEKAKNYFEKGIKVGRLNNNDHTLFSNYAAIAFSNRHLNLFEEANKAIDSAIFLANQMNSKRNLTYTYIEKGEILLKGFKDNKNARLFFQKGYQIAKDTKVNPLIFDSLKSLADLSLYEEDYAEFLKLKNELKVLISKDPQIDFKAYLEKILTQYYEKTKKPEKALFHYKSYIQIRDSISNEKVQTKIADLEKKYDTEKKELQIVKLGQEKEKQEKLTARANLKQNLFLGFSILLVVLLAFGTWVFLKLRKQQQQLGEAHQNLTEINQVKNRLFSIIAHDLRGMLLPFQRSGKILKYHIDKGNHERTIELSQELEKNSESLSTMLDNLLSWSLEQMNGYRLHPEQLSVANQLQEIVQGFEQQAAYKNTKIDVKYKTDVTIEFDKGAFHVIFRNLIGNALKYTEKGNIRIEFRKDFNTLVCSVTDTGVGMTEEQLQDIFTLEDNKTTIGTHGEKGTGLGLNLVYRFVKMHNGIIKVSSEKRIGTRFDISLPITTSLNKQTEGVKPMSA